MDWLLTILGLKTLWERVEFLGIVTVVLGVLGEYFLAFKKFPFNPTGFDRLEMVFGRTKKSWEAIFSGLVVAGLAVELFAFLMVLKESHNEIARLNDKTASLYTSNIIEQAKVEDLRKKNDETLEKLNESIQEGLEMESLLSSRTSYLNSASFDDLGQYRGVKFAFGGERDSESLHVLDLLCEKLVIAGWVPDDRPRDKIDGQYSQWPGVIVVVWTMGFMDTRKYEKAVRLASTSSVAGLELVNDLRGANIDVRIVRIKAANGQALPQNGEIQIIVNRKPSLDEIRRLGFSDVEYP